MKNITVKNALKKVVIIMIALFTLAASVQAQSSCDNLLQFVVVLLHTKCLEFVIYCQLFGK